MSNMLATETLKMHKSQPFLHPAVEKQEEQRQLEAGTPGLEGLGPSTPAGPLGRVLDSMF